MKRAEHQLGENEPYRACTQLTYLSQLSNLILAALQAAQQIVVLDGGQVAEIGTHDELVQRSGLYSELVSTQSLSLSLSV